jgi:DNA-binding LytR/AlgR family response regulator
MSGMNGMELAKHLKEIYSKTYIVFVTGHSK